MVRCRRRGVVYGGTATIPVIDTLLGNSSENGGMTSLLLRLLRGRQHGNRKWFEYQIGLSALA